MDRDIEQQIVFALGLTSDGKGPVVVIGVPSGAAAYMADGKTHTIDLSKAGIPMRLVMFGGKDHAEIMKHIEAGASAQGVALLDERNKDFGI